MPPIEASVPPCQNVRNPLPMRIPLVSSVGLFVCKTNNDTRCSENGLTTRTIRCISFYNFDITYILSLSVNQLLLRGFVRSTIRIALWTRRGTCQGWAQPKLAGVPCTPQITPIEDNLPSSGILTKNGCGGMIGRPCKDVEGKYLSKGKPSIRHAGSSHEWNDAT